MYRICFRVTPAYMLVLMALTTLYHYLGNGPLWVKDVAVADECRTQWWTHLLYINNLVGNDGKVGSEQVIRRVCMYVCVRKMYKHVT